MTACPPRRQTAAAGILTLAGSLTLAGCNFPPPLAPADRVALQDCRSDADRVFNARNRYQLSERDERDTPFSGGSQAAQPSDGLADQYDHAQMVDDCLRHTDAGPPVPTPAH